MSVYTRCLTSVFATILYKLFFLDSDSASTPSLGRRVWTEAQDRRKCRCAIVLVGFVGDFCLVWYSSMCIMHALGGDISAVFVRRYTFLESISFFTSSFYNAADICSVIGALVLCSLAWNDAIF